MLGCISNIIKNRSKVVRVTVCPEHNVAGNEGE